MIRVQFQGPIKSLKDVVLFWEALIEAGVSWDGCDEFESIVEASTRARTFDDVEATRLNELGDAAHRYCEEHGFCLFGIGNDVMDAWRARQEVAP